MSEYILFLFLVPGPRPFVLCGTPPVCRSVPFYLLYCNVHVFVAPHARGHARCAEQAKPKLYREKSFLPPQENDSNSHHLLVYCYVRFSQKMLAKQVRRYKAETQPCFISSLPSYLSKDTSTYYIPSSLPFFPAAETSRKIQLL